MSDEQEKPQGQQFFYDEFFGDDEGVEIYLVVRGREVPMRIRRGLTLKEKAAAQASGVHRSIDPNTGAIKIDRIDEGKAAEEIAFRMLISWPFVNRDGSPVPVTRENVSKLLGGMDKLVEIAAKMESEGDRALIPFVAPYAGDSVAPAAPTSVSPQEVSPSESPATRSSDGATTN